MRVIKPVKFFLRGSEGYARYPTKWRAACIPKLARDFAENEIKPIALELDAKPNWEDRIPW